MFCLPREYLARVKQAIKDGKFDVEKFNTDSATRRKMLGDIVGEVNAEQVNTIYEQKLLLKNQETAMYKFIKDITGLTAKEKEVTMAKLRETLEDKKAKLYDPKENENFLNELTSDIYIKKYKTEVSLEEAQTITELSRDMKVAKDKIDTTDPTHLKWKTKDDGLQFGVAKVAKDNYVNDLRIRAIRQDFVNPFKETGIANKISAIVGDAKTSVNFILDNTRAIVASIDNSFWGRQGLRALLDPRFSKTWIKDFGKSWNDIYQTIKAKDPIKAGDAVLDATKAEIYSRDSYINGRYEAKVGNGPVGTRLDIATGEEAYPTSKPSQIYLFGRFFKASEVAYEGGAMRLRADIADKVYSMAEKTGADMKNNKVIGDLNEVINSMTGRGSFGKRAGGFESATNKAFFSIKFFKSNLDYLTLHQGRLGYSPATKLAATNLLYTVATTGIVLELAKTLLPEDNKDIFNPTSSNFGKIRVGNMVFDLTHGAGGIVVLAAKMLSQKSTSSTTGITTKLGEGYGAQNGMDVLWSFTENKFSPAFAFLKTLAEQKTFTGKKPSVMNTIEGFLPITMQNIEQFKNEPMAKRFLGLIADGIGINTNVYQPTTDWGQSTGVELQQFKAKVGDTKFKDANTEFNKRYADWFNSMKSNSIYNALSDEDKKTVISTKKSEIKSDIFKEYLFKFKTPKTKKLPKL
jgi:hypothetical protein